MGKLFAEELNKCGWLDNIDGIVPVPLHKRKEYKRGFNQSVAIAGGLAGVANKPVYREVLKRVKNTESQTRKSRAESIENMEGVFVLQRPEEVTGKHLLLVDDVLTTGATLEACALTLLKMNNVKVSIATLALAID